MSRDILRNTEDQLRERKKEIMIPAISSVSVTGNLQLNNSHCVADVLGYLSHTDRFNMDCPCSSEKSFRDIKTVSPDFVPHTKPLVAPLKVHTHWHLELLWVKMLSQDVL